METPKKKVLFLLPASAGERISIDGYTDALKEIGIDSDIMMRLEIEDKEYINDFTTTLSRKGYDLIIYPEFNSDIFDWERIRQTSFSPKHEDDIDIKAFIKLLEDKGCRLLAESMQLFGQEVKVYGTPANFAQYIREKLDSAV